MRSLGVRLRAAALLAAGAYVVHQLRYLFAYGGHSHEQLGSQGNAYLAALAPMLALLAALAAVEFLAKAARARSTPCSTEALPRTSRLWALSSGWLLVVYVAQEWIEGQLAPGHPAGVAGVFGHGGWLTLVLSVVVGGVVALALRGASAAIEVLAAGGNGRPQRWSRVSASRPAGTFEKPPLDPVALFLAGRGPPLTSP